MSKPFLKFCGVRTIDDLTIVSNSKADYIGFIFAESKRQVDPKLVKSWIEKVDVSTKKLVAVFVNPSAKELNEVLSDVAIDVIQFHGNESVEEIINTKKTFTGAVWKALHHHPKTLDEMNSYKDVVDGFVIDSRTKSQWGGDWC